MTANNPTPSVCPKCGAKKTGTHGFACGSYIDWEDDGIVQLQNCRQQCRINELTAELTRLKSPAFGEELERKLDAKFPDEYSHTATVTAEARRIAEGLIKGVE